MIGWAVRCSSGRPSPPRPGRSGRPSPWAARSFPVLIGVAVLIGAGSGQKKSQGGRRGPFTLAFSFLLLIEAGRVLPGADRGRGRRALVPAAPDPPARGTRHGSRWHRSRAAQFRRRMIRQNAAGRRGQILHLTAYRPIGNGELGSMPPYYPPLAPFFPGFRRGLLNFQRLPFLLHSGIEGIKYIILQTFSAGNSCGADCCAFAPFRANRDTIPACVVFIARHFVRF